MKSLELLDAISSSNVLETFVCIASVRPSPNAAPVAVCPVAVFFSQSRKAKMPPFDPIDF